MADDQGVEEPTELVKGERDTGLAATAVLFRGVMSQIFGLSSTPPVHALPADAATPARQRAPHLGTGGAGYRPGDRILPAPPGR